PKNYTHKLVIDKGIFKSSGKYVITNTKENEEIKAGDIITNLNINHSPFNLFKKEYKIKAITLNHLFKNAKTQNQYFAITEIDLKNNMISGKSDFSKITFTTEEKV